MPIQYPKSCPKVFFGTIVWNSPDCSPTPSTFMSKTSQGLSQYYKISISWFKFLNLSITKSLSLSFCCLCVLLLADSCNRYIHVVGILSKSWLPQKYLASLFSVLTNPPQLCNLWTAPCGNVHVHISDIIFLALGGELMYGQKNTAAGGVCLKTGLVT